MLENVLNAIDGNTALTSEFKEDLKGLVIIFNTIFSNVDLSNLEERVKTLKVESASKYVSKKIYNYTPLTNVLSFNLEELNKGYDMRHVMMCALLNIMTAHDNDYGFDKDKKFIAFNIGYTELLANFIIGNESEKELFEEELISAQLISEVVGTDNMFKAYFANNPELIEEKIVDFDKEIV